MSENQTEVDYKEYIEMKFQLTYELKTLTENVNRLTETLERTIEDQNRRIQSLEDCIRGNKEKVGGGSSSLSSPIKWLLALVLGIAFLGALGAAIGINLLGTLEAIGVK